MALKSFHIVFVVLSTLMSIGFGAWATGQFFDGNGTVFLIVAVAAVAFAAALIAYGFWFLRKLKHVSFL